MVLALERVQKRQLGAHSDVLETLATNLSSQDYNAINLQSLASHKTLVDIEP